MDLILNYISSAYEQFQKAINGFSFYKNMFFYSNEKPKYLKKNSNPAYPVYEIKTDNNKKTVFQYNFN